MKVAKITLLIALIIMGKCLMAQVDAPILRLIDMRQYVKAKSSLYAKLRANNSIPCWYTLGKVYLEQGNTDSSRICLEKTISLDPKNLTGAISQALIEHIAGNDALSLQLLDKATKTAAASKDVPALIEIAEARFIAGDKENWLTPLTTASTIDKKNPEPYLASGKIYKKIGESDNQTTSFGLASGRFEQALYNDPSNEEALNLLAELYLKVGNYSDAEEKLSKVVQADSTYLPALRNLGELEYTLGKYQSASEVFGQYIRQAEYSDADLNRYITILYFNKEYASAEKYINMLLEKDPSNPVMLRLKGYTSYELNKNMEGLDAMNKFFALRSEEETNKVIASDHEYYGKLLARTGNDSLAVVELEKAIGQDSTRSALLEDIAKSYEKQKRYPEAVKYTRMFIDSKGSNVSSITYFNLGKDLLLLANDEVNKADSLTRHSYLANADSAFSKVVEVSPNSHLGYQWRARSLASMDPETVQGLARADYEKTIAILEQKNDPVKYKNDLLEGYRYLGYYHYLQAESQKASGDHGQAAVSKENARNYWQKVLNLDPENKIAKQALEALNK